MVTCMRRYCCSWCGRIKAYTQGSMLDRQVEMVLLCQRLPFESEPVLCRFSHAAPPLTSIRW